MLFVELALIRWLGSNIIYLSYFSNFVLLGSFLGIGIGFLRAKSLPDLFPWAVVELAVLIAFVHIFPVELNRSGSQLIYFGGAPTGAPIWIALPAVFLASAAVMASIAQRVGRLFARFEALEAYRLDILGSLAGIVAFSFLSFLGAAPIVWGVVASALFLALYFPSLGIVQGVAVTAILIMLGTESSQPELSWSPYYKIAVIDAQPGVRILAVNSVGHQAIESVAYRQKHESYYFLPYAHLRSNPLSNVLIIGAGTGGDVAIALAQGAKHVDAVEIDPRIYQIGRMLDPDHPFQQPRVTEHIDDGRAFLQQTHNRYDLILFALPDSLTLVSGQSSLRLESYLFTLESMRAARAHLNRGGAFGMYNYYRENWLIDRFAHMLEIVYGQRPCVDAVGRFAWFATLMVGREPGDVACGTAWRPAMLPVPPPVNDDYPFPVFTEPLYTGLVRYCTRRDPGLLGPRSSRSGGPFHSNAQLQRSLLHGRGIFATRNQKRGAVCPALRNHVVRQRVSIHWHTDCGSRRGRGSAAIPQPELLRAVPLSVCVFGHRVGH